jgi:uncharacterized membrane protein (UPF0127 family)
MRLSVLGLAALFGAFLATAPADAAQAGAPGNLEIVSADGAHHFIVEVAASSQARARGLMYRRKMARYAGMLFNYGYEQPVSMWMKNTFIPLDILFISKSGRIINVAERTVPHSLRAISSAGSVLAVLEVVAGTVERLNIKVGDDVRHAIFSPAR